jgi:NAD(P)-dependent dehydrogenase (short-subunit alcohol dehydrogenase family)
MGNDKTVLVLGANGGIGYATAQRFVVEGYNVIIHGRNKEALDQAKSRLASDRVSVVTADMGKLTDLTNMYNQLEADGVKLDSLVINAALASPMPFDLVDEANFDLQINVNLKGAFFALQKALPLFNEKSSAVFVTSIANQASSPNFSAYAASKGAVAAMIKTISAELIGRGVRVNAVSPGPIETPMFDKLGIEEADKKGLMDMISERSPMGRFGKPEEVAESIYFLCSDASSYTTGVELCCDGGMSTL